VTRPNYFVDHDFDNGGQVARLEPADR